MYHPQVRTVHVLPDQILAGSHRLPEGEDSLPDYLLAAGRGDHKAFQLVYALTYRRLFRICFDICHSHQVAEDALAETYLSVFRRCDWWDPARGSAMTWLSAIARNRAIDRLRCLNNTTFCELLGNDEIPDLEPNGEETLLESERAARLHRCIGRLPRREQDVLRLAFFEGYTYSELARLAGVPHPTMKSTIRRALARLSRDPELARARSSDCLL